MRPTPLAVSGAPISIGDRTVPAGRARDAWYAGLTETPVTGGRHLVAGVHLHEVTFAAREPDPEVEVMVHLNGLTDGHREHLEAAILHPSAGSQVRASTYLLSSDGTYSYRLVRGRPLDRLAGRSRSGWLRIHRAGEPDPRCRESLPHPHGDRSSVWTGPDAPRSAGWGADGGTGWDSGVVPDHGDGVGRSWWWRAGRSDRCLVLFDGRRWLDLGLGAALRAGLDDPPSVLLIDTIDVEHRARDLPDPQRAADVVARCLAAAERGGHELPPAGGRIVAGQSYGGLAAASIVVHRPDLARTAISQSGSFWYRDGDRTRMAEPGRLTEAVGAMYGRDDVRLILQAGTDEAHMLAQSRLMAAAADRAGIRTRLTPWRGGHDYSWWRHGLIAALRQL